jgi:5-methylcytosine-specific restriction protein A
MAIDGYPKRCEIEDALLKALYGSGTKRVYLPKEVYPILANRFGLSDEQRKRPRNDTYEPLWNNMVQWARRKLVDDELMNSAPRGKWSLTDFGMERARQVMKSEPDS